MKAECCKPPSANPAAQQQRMDRWRREFNFERPHEALGMRVPADVYHASARRMDERIKPELYGLGVETKTVNTTGFVSVGGSSCYVGEAFAGVEVALEGREKDGLIHVRYANIWLGTLGDSPSARLRPTASAARRENSACDTRKE